MALTPSDREAVLRELDLAAFDMDTEAGIAAKASAPRAAERLKMLAAETDRCRDAMNLHGDRAERKVNARLRTVRAEWNRIRQAVPALAQRAAQERAVTAGRKGSLMALHALALQAGWSESDWQSAYEELRKATNRRTPEIGHGNKKAEVERRAQRMQRLRAGAGPGNGSAAPLAGAAGGGEFADLVD